MKDMIRLVIHGGAGNINVSDKDKHVIEKNLKVLKDIVDKNYQLLANGASALEIAEKAVIDLENDEGFNAGRGAVLNSNGVAELDAGIMDGRNRLAGAVAAATQIKNPISGARAIMEYSQHVMLVGNNADIFCEQHRVEIVKNSYFITEHRKKQLAQMRSEGHVLDIDSLGTVGAVVRDFHGNLATATSTGGKANKTPGRVGDSPIFGAGTWADNNTCAISATGDGEMFMRCAFTHAIATRIQFNICDLNTACQEMLDQIASIGGEGGCIAIDKQGNIAMFFNTFGMYRAWIDAQGVAHSAV